MKSGFKTPDVTEELERKTVECLENWLFKISREEVTHQRAYDALSVIWDCTAGLVSHDTMDTISEVMNYLNSEIKKEAKA